MKTEYNIIGIMSGTSLDGLDISACHFSKDTDGSWSYGIEAAECIVYGQDWKWKLADIQHAGGRDLILAHADYGRFIGETVNAFIKMHAIRPDLIASHGHTIFHDPAAHISFQLGDGAAIHATTGIPVVCDFRSVDVQLGGQGAPLVPVGDALLFNEFEICLNLGGIANISMDSEGKRVAWDICGCNLLLNQLAGYAGREYDAGGELARHGKIHQEMLNRLNSWPYLQLKHPKSLDKETMLAELKSIIGRPDVSVENKLATVCEHTAIQIASASSGKSGRMLITGGGAFNTSLVEKIREKCGVECIVPDDNLVQYKEALIFGFLGLLRVRNEVNTLATVTGASRDSVGGAIYGPLGLKFNPDNNKL